ncbi:MAG: MFS transporter [Roseitalea porphyridii]|jgi:predicted MFS family arabinose efflux permease|uniref:MFS transporter n=1 Tax=Alphaproteobacteria TaxID=28211 RepID=UPI0032EFF95B
MSTVQHTAGGAPPDARRLHLARLAVYAAFFLNGFMVGHWATKIPVLVDRLGISEAVLGRLIVLFGIGAVLALVGGAWMVTRIGSVAVVRWTSVLLAPSLVLLTLAPSLPAAALALLWLGVFLGAMDNAMNANGIGVERALGRPVMSSFHGFWSLGGVAGGLTGGAMIAAFGEMGHALIVGAIVLVLAVWAFGHYRPDDAAMREGTGSGGWRGLPRSPGIYVLGLVTLLAYAPEGTVIDWSALYLREELGAPLVVSGYAYAAFSATMATMRLTGDRLRGRFGDRPMFVASALLAATGLVAAGMAPGFVFACLAFLVAGIGMANLAPIMFSAAGAYRDLPPAVSIGVITTFGYAGLLFVPAFVGAVADAFSLAVVFVAWGVVVVAVALAGLVVPGLPSRSSGRADSASARKS